MRLSPKRAFLRNAVFIISPFCLHHSYADTHSRVQGSSPDWTRANMHDNGRRLCEGPPAEFSSQGFKGWSGSTGVEQRSGRKHVDGPTSTSYAEPVVRGAHSTYYARRPNNEDATNFRRAQRSIEPIQHVDRPECKRAISEPYGAPPKLQGKQLGADHLVYREASHAMEPPLPRLLRPSGITGLRESDKELSYERAMGQKVRVGQDSYKLSGRAGDMSLRYGPTHRPEDDPNFFMSLKDSPTFLRFCDSLPAKPAVSPHERREISQRKQYDAEVDRERQLVASLNLPDPDEVSELGPGARSSDLEV
eukprot:gene20176-26912_t